MRLKTTKECIKGKHLYCLRITTSNLSFHNDYFIGFYQHQGEQFLGTTHDFTNDKIKVWTSIKNAENQIRKLYQYPLCKGDIVLIRVDDDEVFNSDCFYYNAEKHYLNYHCPYQDKDVWTSVSNVECEIKVDRPMIQITAKTIKDVNEVKF